VHRLSGYCYEGVGPDADPAGFVTLCLECHEKRHPDKFAEFIQYGGTVHLDDGLAAELGIALPITSKDQLAPFKKYKLVVNEFVQHFRSNGIPADDRQLRKVARDFPDTGLSRSLREQAAIEAQGAFTSGPIGFVSRKEEKAMSKMNEEAKKAFVRERKEKHLDRIMARNAEPTIWIVMKNGHHCRVSI
jgi:hypothetical protein